MTLGRKSRIIVGATLRIICKWVVHATAGYQPRPPRDSVNTADHRIHRRSIRHSAAMLVVGRNGLGRISKDGSKMC